MRCQRVVLPLAALAAALGCGVDQPSPTAPQEPAAAGVAAAAIVFRQVNAGESLACAVSTEDRAYCWGGIFGPLPTAVGGALRFLEVRTGGFYACGLTTDSRIYCWGDNTFGQLGTGSASDLARSRCRWPAAGATSTSGPA